MSDVERGSVSKIAGQIREYLSAHPKAADTPEGIMGWWLNQDDVVVNPEAVQQALDVLVTEQALVRTPSADGHVLYARREH